MANLSQFCEAEIGLILHLQNLIKYNCPMMNSVRVRLMIGRCHSPLYEYEDKITSLQSQAHNSHDSNPSTYYSKQLFSMKCVHTRKMTISTFKTDRLHDTFFHLE